MKKESLLFVFLAIHLVTCKVIDNSAKKSNKLTKATVEKSTTEPYIDQPTTVFTTKMTESTEKTTQRPTTSTTHRETESEEEHRGPIPCTCGVFLTGQFKKGSKDQPKGTPVLTTGLDNFFPNNSVGNRQCTNKCLEMIIKHLPKSSEIICATVNRDHVHKEKAYLFVRNYGKKWIGTNLSAGRDFCCKNNEPYKCPLN